jgi:hypothetical protein
MLTNDPLFEARERAQRLQAEALAEHHRTPIARRLLAGVLRRVANQLDPSAIVLPLNSARG